MTTIETADLFSPATRRERVVDWQAPGPAAKAAAAMSGMEAMRAIRDGILPEPPMARLIDFRLRIAEPGRIVMELEPHESLENTIGLLARRDRSRLARYRHGLRDLDHAAGRAGRGDARSQIDLSAAALGQIGDDLGGRQADQARPPDQLHRGLCPRRRRQSRSARHRHLFDDGRGLQKRNRCSFFRAKLLLYDCKHLMVTGLQCAIRKNTSRKPTRGS